MSPERAPADTPSTVRVSCPNVGPPLSSVTPLRPEDRQGEEGKRGRERQTDKILPFGGDRSMVGPAEIVALLPRLCGRAKLAGRSDVLPRGGACGRTQIFPRLLLLPNDSRPARHSSRLTSAAPPLAGATSNCAFVLSPTSPRPIICLLYVVISIYLSI